MSVCVHPHARSHTRTPQDGFDFDVENRSGDMLKCAALVQGVVDALHAAGMVVTFAPQMVLWTTGGGRCLRCVDGELGAARRAWGIHCV